jgi:hypothetical protein
VARKRGGGLVGVVVGARKNERNVCVQTQERVC